MGGGVGADFGGSYSGGVTVNPLSGWSVNRGCTFAVAGGVYGSVGVGEGPGFTASGGWTTGARFGCSGMITYSF